MQVYSFNTRPRNIWDDIRTRDYGDLSAQDYITQLSESFSPVEVGELKSFEVYNAVQQDSIKQVIEAKSQWEAASDILSGRKNGTLLGFDLETLGYTGQESQSGLSLITEFGLGKRVYDNGSLVDSDYISYAMGANKEQVQELYEIVGKFRTKGLNALDKTEQSTVKRLSMIGSPESFHDVFASVNDENLGYMWTVRNLGEATMNYDDMITGIKRLNSLYNSGAKSEEYLPKILNLFESQAQDSVIYGANAKFDYGMLERLTGIDFSDYYSRTVDVTNGIRIGASSESSSVLSYLVGKTGRVPLHTEMAASMDNLPEIFGLNIKQLHTAGKDVFNEGEILTFRNFSRTENGQYQSLIDSVIQASNSDIQQTRTVDLENSVFFFNRGGMNISKSDFATVNGEVIPQSYSMSNDYWRIDVNSTGTYSLKMPNDESSIERFIAVYQNATDSNVVIRKEYDSAEKFIEELRRNTNQIPIDDISPKQLRDQHKLALLDRGRREFIKGINPGDVRRNNHADEYGLQKLLSDSKKLSIIKNDSNFKGSYTLNDNLLSIVEAHKKELGLHSPYQIQSFAGSIERLHYESKMIDYISKQIDSAYGDTLDNLGKTILFEQVYSNIQEEVSSLGYQTSVEIAAEKPVYNISDVFGIDIDTDNGIKRINTQTVESARTDVDRIFSNTTKEQAISILDDLADRKVISKEVRDKLVSSADMNFKPNEGIYNFTVDVATELSKITDIFKKQYAKSDKVIDEFTTVKSKEITPDYNPVKFDKDNIIAIQNKNLRSVSTEQSLIARGLLYDTNSHKNVHLGALLSKPEFRELVDDSIAKALQDTRVLISGESESKIVSQLADSLNIQTNAQRQILEEMFISKDKPYSLARTDTGMQHFIITPKQGTNDSAFVIVTNDKHVNTVQDILMKQQDDIERILDDKNLSSFQELRKIFDDDAAIIELHHVNSKEIDDLYSDSVMQLLNSTRESKEKDKSISLTSITQGRIEKFTTPTIEMYTSKNSNKIEMKVVDNIEDILSAYRMKHKDFIARVSDNDFSEATTSIRRAQNNVLTKLSAPSSYRGRVTSRGIKRIPNFHAADYINAYEMDIKGVLDLFKEMAMETNQSPNEVQKILEAFNAQHGIVSENLLKNVINSNRKYGYESVATSAQFAEYFAQRLFLGEGSENILDAMINTAQNNKERYSDSVSTVLSNLKNITSEINQILPDSATKHKDTRYMVSFKMPGEFSNLQGLFSTMRPTYYQQNRPMFFTEKDFIALGNMAGGFLNDGYSRIGQSSYSALEYKIKPEDGIKNITTRFKQVSDADLYSIYNSYLSNPDAIIDITEKVRESTKTNISRDKIKKGIEYISSEMSNVYEGKWYVDPLLGQTAMFTDIDAKRISPFNVENINVEATTNFLRKKKYIESGDQIGISINNQKIFYDGPRFKVDNEIIDNLTSYGYSYIMPETSMIDDIKLMIGSEKGTAHTISMENFMKHTGLGEYTNAKDLEKATQIAHGIFQELFGANIVGNISAVKHNNNYAAWSTWNIIETQFKAADRLSGLEALIRKIPEFDDWNFSINKNNDLILDTSHSKNIVQAIRKLEDRLKTDAKTHELADDALYKLYSNILSEIEYTRENNIIYGGVQRVHMNEHLSNMFKMDKRLEQAIRLRNQDFYEIKVRDDKGRLDVRGIDDKYIDEFKKLAMSEDIGIADVKYSNMDLFQAYANNSSVNNPAVLNAKRYNIAAQKRTNDITGVIQARDFLFNGEIPKNTVKITIDDLKNSKGERIIPKGANVDDLRNFIFDIDGKPSEFLQRLAHQQGVELEKDSYSVYFDFGQKVTINLGKNNATTISGVVLPRLNVLTTTSGMDEYFVDSQRNVTSLMNSILDYIDNEPGHKELKDIIELYGSKLVKNTQMLDSDSDLYKAVGRWAMPNSGQFLSQDETAALVEDMFTDGLYDKYLRQEEIRKQIINKDYSNIDEYNTLSKEIKEGLSKIADEIEETDKLPEFQGIKLMNASRDGTRHKFLSSIIEIDGKQTYNNAVAIGERGFKELGFDFGKAGMDLLSAQQTGKKFIIPGMAEGQFVVSQSDINALVKKINEQKIGIKLDANDKDIIGTLNSLLKDKYGLDPDTSVSIRDINHALTNKQKKEVSNIFEAFENIGKKYATEVGLFGEHVRYPTFVGQPAVNVKLDTTITGRQMRFLNPLFSLFTNVDFDGDTTFLSLILNGNSVGTYENKAFKFLHESWKQGMSKNRSLIADKIRDGEAFKRDLLTDYDYSYASMLKSFKENEFWEAVNEFVDVNMPEFRSLSNAEKEANEGLMMAAMHSKEMISAWEKAGINTLTDKQVILASMIPNIRKLDIGMFSTPNFNLRDVILEVRNNDYYDLSTRTRIADILSDMSNMKTHGLMDITEQKGIDVKHIIDAHNVTSTPKWSIGMSKMFKRGRTIEDREKGLIDLIEASKSILFKDYRDKNGKLVSTEQIAEEILSKTREELKQLGDDNITVSKRWLRGVFDISEIEGTDVMFSSVLKKGNAFNTIVSDIINDTPTHAYGTLLSELNPILEKIENAVNLKYETTGYHVYIKPGDMSGSKDAMYITDGIDGDFITFKEVNIDKNGIEVNQDGRIVYKSKENLYAGTIRQANNEADKFFGNIGRSPEILTVHDITEENAAYRDAMTTVTRKKTSNTINTILGKNGITEYEKFLSLDDVKKINYGKTQYDNITRLFGSTRKEAEQQLQRVQELELAYKYYNSGNNNTGGIKPLIAELNQDIIDNPNKYANTTFSDALYKKIADYMGGDTIKLEKALDMQAKFGNIIDEYDSAIKSLNNGLYDIISAKDTLNKDFDTLEKLYKEMQNIDEVKDFSGDISTRVSNRQNIINDTLSKLRNANQDTISKAQDTVYKLFKDNQQMVEFFRLNEHSIDTKVGFGSYLGVKFGNLSDKDISNILSEAKQIQQANQATGKYATAVLQTEEALRIFKRNNPNIMRGDKPAITLISSSKEVQEIITQNKKIINDIKQNIDVLDEKQIDAIRKKAEQNAKNNTKKRILDNEAFSGVKDIAKKYITPKNIGIAAAGMAALGIANNLLHRQRNQSPLAPEQTASTSPSIAGNNPSVDLPPQQQQAPASKNPLQKRVVYHDNQSGLNFKVSAKTKHNMDARQTSSLINNAGGGQVGYSVTQDTSGVSDNWLANKFAELA